jgi:hypothetical protein
MLTRTAVHASSSYCFSTFILQFVQLLCLLLFLVLIFIKRAGGANVYRRIVIVARVDTLKWPILSVGKPFLFVAAGD